MLVYRSARRRLAVLDGLSDLEARITTLATVPSRSALDAARSLLIDAGELEAGLVDSECPSRDDLSPLGATLDALLLSLAEVFIAAWRGTSIRRAALAQAGERAAELRSMDLPAVVDVSTPEGFAFYGLFPETYIQAADELVARRGPRETAVIGIRSIGTTLSAVVTAALRARGVGAQRLTVRPRGHPFDRQLELGDTLERRFRQLARSPDLHFAVVDEGPGLSGSSFASVVERIASLGVPDERIVLFPSWDARPEMLRSARARRIWTRHAKFVGDFDQLWLKSQRIEQVFDARVEQDLSAGSWRALVFPSSAELPPVQPQHERRKFLLRGHGDERTLLKFEGLDRGAYARYARAQRAASAGFTPPVRSRAHGFIVTQWMEGIPLDESDVTRDLLRRVARYLAWIGRCERTGQRSDPAPLLEMLRVNAGEGLGGEWGDVVPALVSSAVDAVARTPAVRVDGRMSPHEWLRTPYGFLKTDVASHFDDHFYPGETDVSWDLAGAIVELGLDAGAEQMLLREYQGMSGDRNVAARLGFMRPAYTAFRLGYAAMAGDTLGGSDDGRRMRAAAARYADLLRRDLCSKSDHDQSRATGT